ncbi:MAG: macrolide ABC transporter ATP-binding protein [delta proteobacterium ML8_D]|jgi:putative ABC transport system ATP-binding protein|nr:MAG: macrolide ABC transporter ATP-binding protein [delta proteobacterium ML8_D]
MITLEHVHRVFQVGDQEVHALNDLMLHIDRGEYLSIMGPSGSGKSTLLNILGILDHSTSGRYLLDGTDVTALSDDQQALTRREKIGFVFQFFHLVPRLTAEQNIELPLVLAGVPPAERKARAGRMLQAVGLKGRAHHRPEELSGGQRQRVAIARATIMEPAVLLADEPTGNLDRTSGKEVIEILEDLNRKGIILIVVTHDPEIGGLARRRIRLVDGCITSDVSGHTEP